MEATHYPLQKLQENILDIAIISDPIKDENIKYVELFQDEMMMVVSEITLGREKICCCRRLY